MNSEQLQDFLTDLSHASTKEKSRDDVESTRKFLSNVAHNTMLCMNYIICNYRDIDLVQPIIAQILALFYKGGILRQYALQYIPSFISTYLFAFSKKQQKSVSLFETFFLAIYNEEILAGGPKSDNIAKKVEEVRIPSIRYPSIYHDPIKINSFPETTTIKPGSTPSVLTTVRIGPFPTVENFTAESKFLILARLMKSVNSSLCYLSSDVTCRHVCLCMLSICQSGFSFPDTSFRTNVMGSETSSEVLEDHSKYVFKANNFLLSFYYIRVMSFCIFKYYFGKPRQHINASLLLELLTGVYLALFNGASDLAIRALEAAHHRAQYEMLPEVLIVTNAIRNSLVDIPLNKDSRDLLQISNRNGPHCRSTPY